MRRVFRIVGALLACGVVFLWVRVLTGNHQDYIEVVGHTRFQVLLMSDPRGVVFDVFIRQLPPEKAPGRPGSVESQRWSRPRAERAAAAYARYLGFEKGIQHRHGQNGNDPIYFYGVDHYFAVPHLVLIFVFALPALWPLRHLSHRMGVAH